ncbi:MAG: type II toxin-antitoxin system PemK/MazF family toxin [Sedimentisphaerales bacterium]|nr:type II toxin-antitoxin system PemK/MazF family toxin [Sedimentisphaerales bacterium]
MFVILSQQVLIESRYSTVICAPVDTAYEGLATQVPVGPAEGLKHASSIHCDELASLPKSMLTNYVGTVPPAKMHRLAQALRLALDIPDQPEMG